MFLLYHWILTFRQRPPRGKTLPLSRLIFHLFPSPRASKPSRVTPVSAQVQWPPRVLWHVSCFLSSERGWLCGDLALAVCFEAIRSGGQISSRTRGILQSTASPEVVVPPPLERRGGSRSLQVQLLRGILSNAPISQVGFHACPSGGVPLGPCTLFQLCHSCS